MVTFELTKSQQSVVNYILENDEVAVRGKAGSGKTLVAAAAANELANSPLQTSLLEDKYEKLPIVLVTYTFALVNYTKNNLTASNVQVLTVHNLLRKFMRNHGHNIVHDNKIKRSFLNNKLDTKRYSINFMGEEFSFIYGKGLKTKESYLKAERIGRGRGRIDREYIFGLFEEYQEHLYKNNVVDYDDIGNVVLDFCKNNNYNPCVKHLVIDEIQDLPVTFVQALQKTVAHKKIYIGDVAQSIYGSGFTWTGTVGKTLRSRELLINFRNTQQIYEAANSIIKFDYETVIENNENNNITTPKDRRDGSKPDVFFCGNIDIEVSNVLTQIQEKLKEDESQTIVVGYRNQYLSGELIKQLKRGLNQKNIQPIDRNTQYYAKGKKVHFSSMHSMKGLEYDHVILVDLDEDHFFNHVNELTDEIIDIERRLLFVAMTRAKETLSLYTRTKKPIRFLSELSPNKINVFKWDEESYEYTYREQINQLDAMRELIWEDYYNLTNTIEKLEEKVDQISEEKETESSEKFKLSIKLNQVEKEKKQIENALKYFNTEKQAAKRNIEDDSPTYRFRENAKVLILGGDGGIKSKDISGIFKLKGLDSNSFEMIPYDEITNTNINQFMDTQKYSDIFIGTTPHSAQGIGKSTSFLKYILDNKKDFPKIQVCKDNNGHLAKFTKTRLKKYLDNSDLYASKKGL